MRITALRGMEAAKRRAPSPDDPGAFWPWEDSYDGGRRSGLNAFTLLEVIVACAIFFMVAFAVLGLVTRSLAAARSLQLRHPDAGMLASSAVAWALAGPAELANEGSVPMFP